MDKQELLTVIQDRYVQSGEFNGWHLRGANVHDLKPHALDLLADGLVQVVSSEDYMNIHIRPWTTKRTYEAQRQGLESLSPEEYGVCLYPTDKAMHDYEVPPSMLTSPFSLDLLRGKGSLEVAFFETDVLENYLNNPKFSYHQGDFGIRLYLTDEAYLNELGLERDQVSMSHLGFGYNFEEIDIEAFFAKKQVAPAARRVCAFYCDLHKLTPEHQQRWKSFEVSPRGLMPHPVWWGMQMGHWADGLGPFERLFVLLKQINGLTEGAFGHPLFRLTERSEELGWMLRPTQREWGSFALTLDKFLSDNLNAKFFDGQNVRKKDYNGHVLGTLRRLEEYLVKHGVEIESAKSVMGPLRKVRKERQAPAHKMQENGLNADYFYEQIGLINQVVNSLQNLKDWFSTHPANADFVDDCEDLKFYIL